MAWAVWAARSALTIALLIAALFITVWPAVAELVAIAGRPGFLRPHHRGALTIVIAPASPAVGFGRRAERVAPFEGWAMAGHRTHRR